MRFRKKESGLSLVELIIGVALASVIIGGVIQVFLANRQAFTMTESLVRIQENGRFAINYISNAIRQTGSYGCVPVFSAAQQNIRHDAGSAAFEFAVYDAIQPGSGDGVDMLPAFDAPDTLELLQLTENSTTVDAANIIPGNLALDPSSSNFSSGRIYLVSNCLVGDYVEAGNATTNAQLDVTTDAGFRLTQYNRLDQVTTVNEVRHLSFSVDPGQETLQVNINGGGAQDLIDGIENIQFTYGVDRSGDFNPDYFDDFSNIPAADVDNIIAIHVQVLAVSNLEMTDNVISEPKSFSFGDVDNYEIPDFRLRKIFESTITLRNQVN